MTLPPITDKQKQIPKLIFQYRVLDRVQIQKFLNHKDKRRINSWIKDLTKKQYIISKYSKKYGENTKPTVVRIGINGIRYLKTTDDCSPEVLKRMYRDAKTKDPFINRCILLGNIGLELRSKSKGKVSYYFETQSDFAHPKSEFNFLTKINPHIVFVKQTGKTKEPYLLEVFDENFPNSAIRKRIKAYCDFFLSKEWDSKLSFPPILIICQTLERLIYAKRFAIKTFKDGHIKNLSIRFATVSEAKENGAISKIWEEIKF